MRVEDIMSHSFKELHSRRTLKNCQEELTKLQQEVVPEELKNETNFQKLALFYDICSAFIKDWNSYSVSIV